jgi:transcriptional regulator with XRE-family HTH domain
MDIKNGALGAAIRTARITKKMTQERLAEEIGVTPTHLKNMEGGRRIPSLSVLYRLVRVLNFSVDGVFFPGQAEGDELRCKIERRLRECSAYELNVIHATIEALAVKSEN